MPFGSNYAILMNSLKLSLPLMSTHIIGVAGKQFDKYIIGVLSSVGGTGVYAIGQKISNIAFVYMTALQNVFHPIVYHKMFTLRSRGGKDIGKYLTPFAFASVAIGLFISLASEEMLKLLAPVEYHVRAQHSPRPGLPPHHLHGQRWVPVLPKPQRGDEVAPVLGLPLGVGPSRPRPRLC